MPDEFDRAQQLEQTYRDAGIARARKAASASQHGGTDDCEECDAGIPPDRRKAVPGATRCVCCQGIADRAAALRR